MPSTLMLCQRPLAPDASDEIALDPRILSPVSSRFPVGLDAAKQDERHEMNGRSEGITKSHDDSQRREVVERNRTNAWFHESDHRGRASAGLSDACSNCESKAWMQCCLQSREREMSTNFSGAKGTRDSCCKNACSLSDEWDARRVHVKQANEEGCTYTCTHTHAARVARQRDSERGWSPVHPSFILQTPSPTLLALDARSANTQLFRNKNSLSTSDSRPMINGSSER